MEAYGAGAKVVVLFCILVCDTGSLDTKYISKSMLRLLCCNASTNSGIALGVFLTFYLGLDDASTAKLFSAGVG